MIHPTAIVESDLPADASVGPFAVIGREVEFGSSANIGAHAVVMGPSRFGDDVTIGPSAVIGTDPQDLKYDGERTELTVGDRTVIREFANINRGTSSSGRTVIGTDCLIMAYVHVAHDCRIGDRVILANAVNLAGHVEIGNDVTIGGVVPVHQFVRVGMHAMIGGGFRINKDIPPFVLASGYPLRVAALNSVGLRRKGFSPERLDQLDRTFRHLFKSPGILTGKASALLSDPDCGEDGAILAEFILSSERGVIN